MPKSDPVAQAMSRLKAIAADPRSAASAAEMAKALHSKANMLVSRAADIIHDSKLADFIDPMIKAFDRFMVESYNHRQRMRRQDVDRQGAV